MAFDLNNFVIDRIVRGVATDMKTGDVLFSINQITNPSLSCTSESTDAVDALNVPIATFYRAKTAEFSAENALFDMNLLATQAGTTKNVASSTNKITVPSESYHKVASTKTISFTFSAKCKEGSLTCKSDNSKIKASISKTGLVTVKIAAKYLGTANISLTSKSTDKLKGETIKVKVTAGPKGTSISSAKSSVAGQAVITWKKNSAVSGYQLRFTSF